MGHKLEDKKLINEYSGIKRNTVIYLLPKNKDLCLEEELVEKVGPRGAEVEMQTFTSPGCT